VLDPLAERRPAVLEAQLHDVAVDLAARPRRVSSIVED
jgi:hypothetical protein